MGRGFEPKLCLSAKWWFIKTLRSFKAGVYTFDRSSNHVLQEPLVAPDHSPIVESEKPLRSCSSASTYHGKVMLHCHISPSCMQDTASKLALILISFGEGAWRMHDSPPSLLAWEPEKTITVRPTDLPNIDKTKLFPKTCQTHHL